MRKTNNDDILKEFVEYLKQYSQEMRKTNNDDILKEFVEYLKQKIQ